MEIPKKWVDVNGKWTFELKDKKDSLLSYHGNDIKIPIEYGLCLNEGRLTQGKISTLVNFSTIVTEARILFGYYSQQNKYYTAGIGGWNQGYSIQEFIPTFGWRGLKTTGNILNILPGKDYKIEVKIFGNKITLYINDVEILEHILDEPMKGNQIGLFTVGDSNIDFKNYSYYPEMSDVFVVMQFTEPYNSLYQEVIVNVAKDFKLNPLRSDDVFGPGIILQDIIKKIIESTIIIAEISPANPNVFYELGYAHALGKPTILLAEKGQSLPFDIQGYRVIFYENTIKGKKSVEENLRKHLNAIIRN
jgi:hypothetical protein